MDTIIEEETLIETANEDSLSLVLWGKPRCGKTSIAAEVAKALDLIHIEPTIVLNEILDKEKPSEEEEDEYGGGYGEDESQPEEKPPVFNEFEQSIVDTLRDGQELSNEQLIALLNYKMDQDVVQNKGYILDMPDNTELLRSLLIKDEVKLKRPFSYSIYVDVPDEDINKLAEGIQQDPESKATYSAWDIHELTKPLERDPEDSEEELDEEIEDTRPKID